MRRLLHHHPCRRIACASVALAALACSVPASDVAVSGDRVAIVSDRGDSVCAGTAAYMDRHLEALFEHVGAPIPTGVFVRYHWLEPHEIPRSTCAGHSSVGCTALRDGQVHIYSIYLPHEHEMAHAVHQFSYGTGTDPVFAEGFAVAFSDAVPTGHDAVPELGRRRHVAADELRIAANIVQSIAEVHGTPVLAELMRTLRHTTGRAVSEATAAAIMGEPWSQAIERATEWPYCPTQLTSCGAPSLSWNGQDLKLEVDLACDAEGVVGASAGSDDVLFRQLTLDVPSDGDYLLHAVTDNGVDEPAYYDVALVPCGPCNGPTRDRPSPTFTIWLPEATHPEPLRAGRHFLRVQTSAANPSPPVTVSIQRVASM